jgi:hypothetical protein
LEVSGAVRPIYGSLGIKRLIAKINNKFFFFIYLRDEISVMVNYKGSTIAKKTFEQNKQQQQRLRQQIKALQ